MESFYQVLLAEALCAVGEHRRAAAILDEVWARTRTSGERYYELELRRLRDLAGTT